MATMTFRYGGYFWFEINLIRNMVGDPHFLFYSMISFNMLNRLINWRELRTTLNVFVDFFVITTRPFYELLTDTNHYNYQSYFLKSKDKHI